MLTDEQIASFQGMGSQGRRAEEDRERERNRQIHLDHVVTGYSDDDDVSPDRERVRQLGGDVVGTTPLSTWARLVESDRRSLAVRPDGDLDQDIESYYSDPDDLTEENRRWGEAVTVAKIPGPTVGGAGLAFPRRFA